MGPIAVLVDAIIEKSQALTELNLAPTIFSANLAIWRACHRGFCDGADYRHPRGYDVKGVLQLAVKTAAVMLLCHG